MKKARVAKQKAQQARARLKAAASTAAPSIAPAAGISLTTPPSTLPAHVRPSYVDAGSGKSFQTRAVMLPEDLPSPSASGARYVYAAGPKSDAEIIEFFRQSSKAASPSTPPSSQTSAAAPTQRGPVKSLVGAGSVLSKKEFTNIMRTQGVSAQKLLERAGSREISLGAGLVNAANRGKLGEGSVFPYSIAGLGKEPSDFIQGMKGLTLSRGQQYSGTYQKDGEVVPVVQARSGAAGLTGYSQPMQAGTAGEFAARSGGKVQKLRAKLQKTKALIKSSQSELAARGL